MKRTLPLALGMFIGAFVVIEYFIPHAAVGSVQRYILSFGQILLAAAFVLGGINVMQVNWPIIRRRGPDWAFKIVILASALITLFMGIKWSSESVSAKVSFSQVSAGDEGLLLTSPNERVWLTIDGGDEIPLNAVPTQGRFFPLAAGVHSISLRASTAGYHDYATKVDISAGQRADVDIKLAMKWGKDGRVLIWIFDNIFDPANSTMFALLAFFIASAAFRAFRARNTEAALLLGTAIIVMIGAPPIGGWIAEAIYIPFPWLTSWVLDFPTLAGQRAIAMGAALGAIVVGLRIILGLERSHLGADS